MASDDEIESRLSGLESSCRDLSKAVTSAAKKCDRIDEDVLTDGNRGAVPKPFSIRIDEHGNRRIFLPEGSVVVQRTEPSWVNGKIRYGTYEAKGPSTDADSWAFVQVGPVYCHVFRTGTTSPGSSDLSYGFSIVSSSVSESNTVVCFMVGSSGTDSVTQNVLGSVVVSDGIDVFEVRRPSPFELVMFQEVSDSGQTPVWMVYLPPFSVNCQAKDIPFANVPKSGWYTVSSGELWAVVRKSGEWYRAHLQSNVPSTTDGVFSFPVCRINTDGEGVPLAAGAVTLTGLDTDLVPFEVREGVLDLPNEDGDYPFVMCLPRGATVVLNSVPFSYRRFVGGSSSAELVKGTYLVLGYRGEAAGSYWCACSRKSAVFDIVRGSTPTGSGYDYVFPVAVVAYDDSDSDDSDGSSEE